MNKFLIQITAQFASFSSKKNLILWVLLLALAVSGTMKGISEYNGRLEKLEVFKKITKKHFDSQPNYATYGNEGIEAIFATSATSAMLRNSDYPMDIIAEIDSHATVKIHNDLKGKSTALGNLNFNIDFSTIVIFLLSFLSMYYGFEIFQNCKNNRTISISGNVRASIGVLLSRFVVFSSYFLILFIVQPFLVTMHGIF